MIEWLGDPTVGWTLIGLGALAIVGVLMRGV